MEKHKETLRFAVIGAGYYATMQVPAWMEVEGAVPVAICNRTKERAAAIAQKYHIPAVYDDAEEMLQKEEIDFVDIITHPSTHARHVLLAAKYKIPAICQKPMALDYQTCKAMADACSAGNVPLLIHENFRWQSPNRGVKSLLDEGTVGLPFRAHIQLATGGAECFAGEPGLRELEDFALNDMGPHLFDLARFFFGEPTSVYCRTRRTIEGIRGDNVACAMLEFEGLTCTCEISDTTSYNVYIEGDRGWLMLDADDLVHICTKEGNRMLEFQSPHHAWASDAVEKRHGRNRIHGIVACNQNLFHSLSTGDPAETSSAETLKTMNIIRAALDSSRSGQPVRLGEPL